MEAPYIPHAFKVYKVYKDKAFCQRIATSLLIKNDQFMKEKRKFMVVLV